MDEATIRSMAAELAKGLKTPEDLNQIIAVCKKFMIETRACSLKYVSIKITV